MLLTFDEVWELLDQGGWNYSPESCALIVDALKHEVIVVERRPFPPDTEDPLKVKVQDHHSPNIVHRMARILNTEKAKSNLEELEILGEPWYNTFDKSYPRYRADVGLVERDGDGYRTIIAVEIGTIKAIKVLDGFEYKSLLELWVPHDIIYVFTRGRNYHLYLEYKQKLHDEGMKLWTEAHPFFKEPLKKGTDGNKPQVYGIS